MEYSGAIYHVLNRGDRREDIFHDDSDRELFLDTLTVSMTLKWIAARLRMGNWTNLSNLLSKQQKQMNLMSICGTDPFYDPFFYGGQRQGAGRKSSGHVRRQVYVSPQCRAKVLRLAKEKKVGLSEAAEALIGRA